jgi:hypothetical protein
VTLAEREADAVEDWDAVEDCVSDGVLVDVSVAVALGEGDCDAVALSDRDGVRVTLAESVSVGVGVADRLAVDVGVAEGVRPVDTVCVGVPESVLVGVTDWLAESLTEDVGVDVADSWLPDCV